MNEAQHPGKEEKKKPRMALHGRFSGGIISVKQEH